MYHFAGSIITGFILELFYSVVPFINLFPQPSGRMLGEIPYGEWGRGKYKWWWGGGRRCMGLGSEMKDWREGKQRKRGGEDGGALQNVHVLLVTP